MPTHRQSLRTLIVAMLVSPLVLVALYVGLYFALSDMGVPTHPSQIRVRVFGSRAQVTVFRPLHNLESRLFGEADIGWHDEKDGIPVIRLE